MYRDQSGFKRKTGFGPATSTLARWSSTPELLSHVSAIIQKIRPLEKLFFSCNDVFIHQSDDENTFSEVRNDKQGILNWKLSLNRSLIMSYYLQLANLSYSWPASSVLLFDDLNLTLDNGWVSFAGANGSGKTTLAMLISGRISPDSGVVRTNGPVCLCPQLFEGLCPDDYQYLYDYSAESCALKRTLGLTEDMFERTDSLSGGEKKRLQVYLALSACPGILILDEPTNHLDEASKALLAEALKTFRGLGILISHDRTFMDGLSLRTVVFTRDDDSSPVRLDEIPLPVSAALEQLEKDNRASLARRSEIRAQLAALHSFDNTLKARIQQSSARMSKRGIDAKDHDAKGRVDAARLTGKDRRDGDRRRALSSRIEATAGRLDELKDVKLRKTGLDSKTFTSLFSSLVIDETVIAVPGYSLTVEKIEFPPHSRTAVTGMNGSGKTLFIRHLAAKAVEKWGADKVAFLKQEYSPEEAECLTAELRNLRDDEKGALVSDLYRLGSSPSSFVTAAGLSPGELRKLDLLLSLRAQPALLIMDEPTNHLDITSVMAFESLLSSSDLTLVLVSHDAKLRQTLCTRTVSVERKGNTGSVRLI